MMRLRYRTFSRHRSGRGRNELGDLAIGRLHDFVGWALGNASSDTANIVSQSLRRRYQKLTEEECRRR